MRIDIVFDKDGNSVQMPADTTRLALLVEISSDAESVGIQLDDRINGGPAFVDLGNPVQILARDGLSGVSARGHAALQLVDGCFVEFKGGRRNVSGQLRRG